VKHNTPEESDEAASISQVPGKRNPKTKAKSKSKKVDHISGDEVLSEDEKHPNDTQYALSL